MNTKRLLEKKEGLTLRTNENQETKKKLAKIIDLHNMQTKYFRYAWQYTPIEIRIGEAGLYRPIVERTDICQRKIRLLIVLSRPQQSWRAEISLKLLCHQF